jgi:NAD+ dependent glucose-6-phosphate dehydrogenase
MRVLVTGAAGNLGQKAVAALSARDDTEVVAVDLETPGGGGDVVRADLTTYDDAWAAVFRGCDVVLHLAGEQSPAADWDTVVRSNIDLSINVLRAAEEAGVSRFVFASSNWVLAGYRYTTDRLTTTTPPRPVNPYGVSKLVVERIGVATAARTGMAYLALRIGYCQPGDNVPGPRMRFGRWGQEMWLSNRDWSAAVQRACAAPFEGCAVVNVMSDNAGMRWDLGDAARIIGYRPSDRHHPCLTASGRLRDAIVRLRDATRGPLSPTPPFGSRW